MSPAARSGVVAEAVLGETSLHSHPVPFTPHSRFLSKHSATFFPRDHTLNYKPANDEYKAAWAASNAAPDASSGKAGASGSSAGAGRPKSVKDIDPRGLLGLPAAWPTASASSAAAPAVAR